MFQLDLRRVCLWLCICFLLSPSKKTAISMVLFWLIIGMVSVGIVCIITIVSRSVTHIQPSQGGSEMRRKYNGYPKD
jgi:hypothetical protein